ncbi:MAG: hypothetical protein WD648_16495 [Planctomycetaceae bacterium]
MIHDDVKIPAGFSILAESPDELRIAYRPAGMGCLLWFLVICLAWVGDGMTYSAISDPAGFRELMFAHWLSVLAFAGCLSAMVYFTWFVMFHLFGETVISVTSDQVSVSRRLFGLGRTKSIPRSDVSHVEQIKDGGEGEDSFPSWGLRLVGRRKCWLISRQSIEKSDWLGGRLAAILRVEFRPSEKRPEA